MKIDVTGFTGAGNETSTAGGEDDKCGVREIADS